LEGGKKRATERALIVGVDTNCRFVGLVRGEENAQVKDVRPEKSLPKKWHSEIREQSPQFKERGYMKDCIGEGHTVGVHEKTGSTLFGAVMREV